MVKRILLAISLLAAAAVALSACSSSGGSMAPGSTAPAASAPEAPSSVAMPADSQSMAQSAAEEQTFTLEELAAYNGKDGQPAYVAVNGVVYDVTNVPEWANGEHKNGLTAGQDLTDAITNQSPHGLSVLESLPVVGKLA